MVFKIWAYDGITRYARDSLNLFDAVLVVISLFDLALEWVGMDQVEGATVLLVFRILRVVRVFKLAKRSENLLTLFQAIYKTMKDIWYFACLMFLYCFIFALLGMEFFAYRVRMDNYVDRNPITDKALGVSPRLHFDSFGRALLTIFCLIVNEDWNHILYAYMRLYKDRSTPIIFFLTVVLIGNFLLLSTFLAILIGNF